MKEYFANPDFGLIGLLFFFVFFCVVAIWTYRPGGKSVYKKFGDIPLMENDE